MAFRKGTDVISREGKKIGELERVVIDPQTREVVYLVVKSGFLLMNDRLISSDQVGEATDQQIVVNISQDHLDELPAFEEFHYVSVENDNIDNAGQFYWYPPPAGWYLPGGYYPFVRPLYIRVSEKNIPENTVALREGAKVFTTDGQHVGNIDRLITDADSEYVTHVVISNGLLLKERKMVPAFWLANVSEDEVHLAVDSRFLDRLPGYNQ